MNPQISVFPEKKGWVNRTQDRGLRSAKIEWKEEIGLSVQCSFMFGTSSTAQVHEISPTVWDTAALVHIHHPADSPWLWSSQTSWNSHPSQDHRCRAYSADQCFWDLLNCLYMCWRHHLHVGREMYKVSHPVPNGLPDVQKSLTIAQNLHTPPIQNCQVEKVQVSKKIQMIT